VTSIPLNCVRQLHFSLLATDRRDFASSTACSSSPERAISAPGNRVRVLRGRLEDVEFNRLDLGSCDGASCVTSLPSVRGFRVARFPALLMKRGIQVCFQLHLNLLHSRPRTWCRE